MAIRRKTVRRKITMPHHPTSFMPSQEVLLRDGLIPHADSMFQRFLIDFDESGFASSLRGLEHDELTDTHSAESFRPKAHFAREDLVVSDRYGYSAFGEMASRTPSTGGTANPFLFNAQQFDGASGNYYLRARYYDQSNGQFISQDPYEGDNQDPVSLHPYLVMALIWLFKMIWVRLLCWCRNRRRQISCILITHGFLRQCPRHLSLVV